MNRAFKPGDLVRIMMYDMDPSEVGVFVGLMKEGEQEDGDDFHSGEAWVYINGYVQSFWFDEIYSLDQIPD